MAESTTLYVFNFSTKSQKRVLRRTTVSINNLAPLPKEMEHIVTASHFIPILLSKSFQNALYIPIISTHCSMDGEKIYTVRQDLFR